MFNTQTPTDKAKDKNNTYGPSFVNDDAMMRLGITFWNKNLVLQINEGTKGGDGIFKANENSGAKLVITASTASSLLAAGEEVIDLIKSGKGFTSIGVPCGIQTSNLIEFSNGKNIDMPEGLYLVIYKDIQADRVAKGFAAYPFAAKKLVKDYNYKTGHVNIEVISAQELKDFLTILEEYSKSMSMAVAHSVKEAQKYEKISSVKTLSIIAAKLGIDLMADLNNTKRPRSSVFESYPSGGDDEKVLSLNEKDFSSVSFEDMDMNFD